MLLVEKTKAMNLYHRFNLAGKKSFGTPFVYYSPILLYAVRKAVGYREALRISLLCLNYFFFSDTSKMSSSMIETGMEKEQENVQVEGVPC